MEKLYERGDIVFLKNQKIYVWGKGYVLDLRVNGHPFVILQDVYKLGEKVSCLILSSKKGRDKEKKEFVVEKLSLRGRRAIPAYIDIGRVYYITFDKRYEVKNKLNQDIMNRIDKARENL